MGEEVLSKMNVSRSSSFDTTDYDNFSSAITKVHLLAGKLRLWHDITGQLERLPHYEIVCVLNIMMFYC